MIKKDDSFLYYKVFKTVLPDTCKVSQRTGHQGSAKLPLIQVIESSQNTQINYCIYKHTHTQEYTVLSGNNRVSEDCNEAHVVYKAMYL